MLVFFRSPESDQSGGGRRPGPDVSGLVHTFSRSPKGRASPGSGSGALFPATAGSSVVGACSSCTSGAAAGTGAGGSATGSSASRAFGLQVGRELGRER